jgi:TRAP transporter TAXI family solute receptor
MAKLDLNQVIQLALGALSLALIAVLVTAWLQSSKTEYLTLAAGASSGESYVLGNALKKVVERHNPRIRITLLETGGTVENLQMLEAGRAQLATAQADITPGPKARALAVLYDDTFQLLVLKDSPAQNLVDLQGHRIGLAQSGGQFQSFLRVVEHFGLHPSDFQFVGANDQAAADAFLNGRADALFRVRAIGDPSIEQLVHSGRVRFLTIAHAAAMKIKYPALEAALIPVGAYLGNPPVPAQDVPTVAVQRTLLARDSANAAAVRAVTEALIERRQEIMQEIPATMTEVRLLLVQTRRPAPQTGLGPALHPGALSFYDRDKPSFLLAHTDLVGLFLTVGLMVGSWIWELKRWMQRQQKSKADHYSNRVVELISGVQEVDSLPPLEDTWRELLKILGEAVRDLDADKLSEESFNSFRAILQIGMEATRERRAMLMSAHSPTAVGLG